MKNFKAISLILLLLVTISCNDKNEDSSVVGDAIVVTKKSGDKTVYAMAYYAYSYSPLKSVSVKSMFNPENKVELAANGSYSTNFIKEPEDADFTTTKPSPDTFTFNAVFESGNTYETEDVTTSDILAPINIEKCSYNTSKSYLELSWTALTNADSYVISVINDSGKIVFRSGEFDSSVTIANLSTSTSGWITKEPVTGKAYTLRIFAYKYENSTNPNSFHIQSTSYIDTPITWGQNK